MKKFYYRLANALKVGYMFFIHPKLAQDNNILLFGDLYALILKVAIENRHYVSHIGYIHPEKGEQQIVSIWAGAGVGADPIKRIQELIDENAKLKAMLSEAIKDKTKLP